MPMPLIFLYIEIKIIEECKLQLKKEKEKNASCREISMASFPLAGGFDQRFREEELKNTSCRDKDKRGGRRRRVLFCFLFYFVF
jgi:hypothetical protein